MHTTTFAIFAFFGVAAMVNANPTGSRGSTRVRHGRPDIRSHSSSIVVERYKGEPGPNYDAINRILAEHTDDEEPHLAAANKILDRPDPLWTVLVAPGYEQKDFTAFCAPATLHEEMRCFAYPNTQPFHYWYITDAQWKKCIEEPRKAAETPQASCLNWIEWHEDDGLASTSTTMASKATKTATHTRKPIQYKPVQYVASGYPANRDMDSFANKPVETMLVNYGASHYSPQDYTNNKPLPSLEQDLKKALQEEKHQRLGQSADTSQTLEQDLEEALEQERYQRLGKPIIALRVMTEASSPTSPPSTSQLARRDNPLATARPADYPNFAFGRPLAYYFDVGRGMACTEPMLGIRENGTIYCFGRESRAPYTLAEPEDSVQGLADLKDCFRKWDICSGDDLVFHYHTKGGDED